MKITIDNKEITVIEGETILEAARRNGIEIPSMCYAEGKRHQAGCMVCTVKELKSGRMLTSCSTKPTEGMEIDTSSEEVIRQRTMALELLLSDHRADCEAPCTMVCTHKLDVEQMLAAYDRGNYALAQAIIRRDFGDKIACEDCKAPCEKACRRGTVDKAVAIREIIREVAAMDVAQVEPSASIAKLGKEVFFSRVGIFNQKEKDYLRETTTAPSRCLHCACEGREACRLRRYSTDYGIKRSRYGLNSKLPVKLRIEVGERLRFEPAKCIRCGLCVYNTENGFTFLRRGFDMQVTIPEQNKINTYEELAAICPTGALYLQKL